MQTEWLKVTKKIAKVAWTNIHDESHHATLLQALEPNIALTKICFWIDLCRSMSMRKQSWASQTVWSENSADTWPVTTTTMDKIDCSMCTHGTIVTQFGLNRPSPEKLLVRYNSIKLIRFRFGRIITTAIGQWTEAYRNYFLKKDCSRSRTSENTAMRKFESMVHLVFRILHQSS